MPSALPRKSCLSPSASSSACSSPSSTTATPPSPALYRGVHPTFVQPKMKKKVRFADPISKCKHFTKTSYSREVIQEEETPKRGKKRKEIRENMVHVEGIPPSGPCPCNCPSCPVYGHYDYGHHPAPHAPPPPPQHHRMRHQQEEDEYDDEDPFVEPIRPKTPAFNRPEKKEKTSRYRPSKVEMTIEFDIDDQYVAHLTPPTPTPKPGRRGQRPHPAVAAPPPPPAAVEKFRPPSIDEFPEMFYRQMPGMGNYWPYEPQAAMPWPYYQDQGYASASPGYESSPQEYASSRQLRRKPRFNKLASQSSSSSMDESFDGYGDQDYEPYAQQQQQEQPQPQQVRTREHRSRKSSNASIGSGSVSSRSTSSRSTSSRSTSSRSYDAAEEQRRWDEDRRVEHHKRRERERRREREHRTGRVVLAGGLSGPVYQQRPALPAPSRESWEGEMI